MILIVSIFSACVLTILATFFAVLNQKAIGDGALYSAVSNDIYRYGGALWLGHAQCSESQKSILKNKQGTGNGKQEMGNRDYRSWSPLLSAVSNDIYRYGSALWLGQARDQ